MHSPDLSQANIEKIQSLFPNCVTEVKGENGEIKLAVDFDLLKQELSDSIVEGPQERYHLNWPGKRNALLTANAPIAKTLRPCREESINFDTTENLFIEGDNLEALKLLQETYLGKVKVIYIDPPYNTGNDFIYKDDFAVETQSYFYQSNQTDDDGNQLTSNSEANGRFHSDWLSMIYSRLKLSRQLLRDDGLIFISIDDNEIHNIRRVCDEIFGQSNFITQFVWKKRTGSNDSKNMASVDHDYVICYGKSEKSILSGILKDSSNYKNPDEDPRGPWAKDNLTCNKTAEERPNLAYEITDPETGKSYSYNPNRVWAYEKERMERIIQEGKVIFPASENGTPMYKRHLSELRSNKKPISSLLDVPINTTATKETRELLGGHFFDFPKSVKLLKLIIEQGSWENGDIVLDFFAGSGTTGHALFEQSLEDSIQRKLILIQLPEKISEKTSAHAAGYRKISEITKARLEKAIKRLIEKYPKKYEKLDLGFRTLKIDSSNMTDVYYRPDQANQADMFAQVQNIKEGRTDEDLLFQVLLDWGVGLTLPISKQQISSKDVFFVNADDTGEGADLIACFASDISNELIKTIAEKQPLRVVFRDDGFATDAVKINVEQIFKQISPITDVKSI